MKLKVLFILLALSLLSYTVFANGDSDESDYSDSYDDHDHDDHDHSHDHEHDHDEEDHHDDRADIDENVAALENGFKEVGGGGFTFRWRIVNDTIEFSMEAPTNGWVGVGFKPSRQMRDADFLLGYVEDGDVVALDAYGIASTALRGDARLGSTDDVTILGGSEENGTTRIQLSRLLNTGDIDYDNVLEEGEEITMIYAWGDNRADNFRTRHIRRGRLTLTL